MGSSRDRAHKQARRAPPSHSRQRNHRRPDLTTFIILPVFSTADARVLCEEGERFEIPALLLTEGGRGRCDFSREAKATFFHNS